MLRIMIAAIVVAVAVEGTGAPPGSPIALAGAAVMTILLIAFIVAFRREEKRRYGRPRVPEGGKVNFRVRS